MTARVPPRYVPTLTERYHPAAGAGAVPDVAAPPAATGASQEQLVRRIMQRVDSTLERRLREAIATAALEQTRALEPLLRAAIEGVLHQVVAQAVADEQAEASLSAPPAP